MISMKMLAFLKEIFLTGLAFLSCLITSTTLSCISMNNQAKIINHIK